MKQISQIHQRLELDFKQDLKVDFWGVLHYRGLEDHGTLLVDAIKAKPTEDTRSGCGSKHHLAVGGGVEEVVTQGGETKRTLRSLRDWEKVSHHYRHSVVHFGHSVSQSACTGLGRLVGDTLPLLPSIHLYPIHLTPADKRLFSCSHFFFVCQGDHSHALVIKALYHRRSHQSSHTGYGQRLWDVLFYILVHLVQPLLEGHIPTASVKTSFKTLICVRKQSLMNDWCVNADSSPTRQNPIVWHKV